MNALPVSTAKFPSATEAPLSLRDRREQAGLSLTRAAALAKIGKGYLSKIEAGKQTPSARVLRDLLAVYAAPPEAEPSKDDVLSELRRQREVLDEIRESVVALREHLAGSALVDSGAVKGLMLALTRHLGERTEGAPRTGGPARAGGSR